MTPSATGGRAQNRPHCYCRAAAPSGRWFGGEPGNRVVGSPVNDIIWDGNHVTATVGRGPTAKIEGFVQEDGSLLLNLGAMGGGAEVTGTPAENEVLVALPNG